MEKAIIKYCIHKVNKRNTIDVIIDLTPFVGRKSAFMNAYIVICEREANNKDMAIEGEIIRRFIRIPYPITELDKLFEDEKKIIGEEKAKEIIEQINDYLIWKQAKKQGS